MQSPAAPSRSTRAQPYLFGLLAGMVVGLTVLVWPLYAGYIGRSLRDRPRPRSIPSDTVAESRRTALVVAASRTRPSVVTIRADGPRQVASAFDRLLWAPFAVQRTENFRWVGSGFLIDARGYVITNEHVVRDADNLVVSMGDERRGTSAPALIVGVAPEFDLALLKLPDGFGSERSGIDDDEPLLVPAQLGDSDDLMVGEWVIAIGSPFGIDLGNEPSVSAGVISAVQRDLPSPGPGRSAWPYLKMIQTDATINDGNSGGPLVNADGEVIGVNAARLEGPVGDLGVGFSIPINTVKWVWEELRDYGEVRKPWIGWAVSEVAPDVRARLSLPEEEGVLTVTRVLPASPAERAGIRPGDVIRSINGLDAYSLARADRILFGTPVGGQVEVEILGDGQLRRVMVHVVEDPGTRAEREARHRRRLG
jgi:serine protease Do